jgi:hypothetical protein
MALLAESALRAEAARISRGRSWEYVLKEQTATLAKAAKDFDVFLSHSRLDADAILGLKLRLEKEGCSVYVDWIIDPELDRSKVTRETAERLRGQMRSCRSLLYGFSIAATQSRWMPWEMGYFDGLKGRVAVVPITATLGAASFLGQEYLGLYPYLDEAKSKNEDAPRLWVNKDSNTYVDFRSWLQGGDPTIH